MKNKTVGKEQMLKTYDVAEILPLFWDIFCQNIDENQKITFISQPLIFILFPYRISLREEQRLKVFEYCWEEYMNLQTMIYQGTQESYITRRYTVYTFYLVVMG
jgi:hypothetical protein